MLLTSYRYLRMKLLLITFFLTVVTVHAVTWKDQAKIIAGCAKETNISDEDVKKSQQDRDVQDSPELRNFLLCVFKKFNVIDENGHLQRDSFVEILSTEIPKEDVDRVVKCTVTDDVYKAILPVFLKCAGPSFKKLDYTK